MVRGWPPDEVRAEVRRLFQVMGAGGGYVLANVHNIQPDVPADILALFEAGRDCRYPPVTRAA